MNDSQMSQSRELTNREKAEAIYKSLVIVHKEGQGGYACDIDIIEQFIDNGHIFEPIKD